MLSSILNSIMGVKKHPPKVIVPEKVRWDMNYDYDEDDEYDGRVEDIVDHIHTTYAVATKRPLDYVQIRRRSENWITVSARECDSEHSVEIMSFRRTPLLKSDARYGNLYASIKNKDVFKETDIEEMGEWLLTHFDQ